MKKSEREQRIISLLDSKAEMSVEEMGRMLSISASTLRKQLAEMQKKGLIIRTYGGVMSVNQVLDESFDSKLHKNTSEKMRMAVTARALIEEGMAVSLGSGTSVYAVGSAMNDLTGGTVYTNSMQVAEYLGRCPALEVHVCGGIIRSHTGTIIGNDVLKFFEQHPSDIAFFSCDAVDSDGVVYSDNLATASSEYAVIMNAKLVYLLCDSTKIGKKSTAKITTLNKCTALITGIESEGIADEFKRQTKVIFA